MPSSDIGPPGSGSLHVYDWNKAPRRVRRRWLLRRAGRTLQTAAALTSMTIAVVRLLRHIM
jgi:hypothetical protein